MVEYIKGGVSFRLYFTEVFDSLTLANIQESSERFNQNMEAMRPNFLLRAYFKKLEKQEQKSLKK